MKKEIRINETNGTFHVVVMFNLGSLKIYKTINDCLFLLENNKLADHKQIWDIELELNQEKQFEMLEQYSNKLQSLL